MSRHASFDEAALPNGLASQQKDALTWVRDRPVALIADATGSGKTAVAAAVLGEAFDLEGARRALWVTEASLVSQAVRELRRFLPELHVSPWPGRSSDHIRVVSVETLTRHVDRVLGFAAHVGVVDDAAIKGHGPEPAAVARVMQGPFRRLAPERDAGGARRHRGLPHPAAAGGAGSAPSGGLRLVHAVAAAPVWRGASVRNTAPRS